MAPDSGLEAPPESTSEESNWDASGPESGPAPDLGIQAVPDPVTRMRRSVAVLGKRRHFLIDRRSQLRAAFLTATAALALLVLLNLSLFSARQQVTRSVLAESPELAQVLHTQNRVELALVVTASLVFLVGVFVVTVLETHKTAGAAFNVARHMAEIEHGNYAARIRLRKDDNLRVLEDAFNGMSQAVQTRAWHEVEHLERFAEIAENLNGPDAAAELGAELRARADAVRRLTD